MHSPAAQHARGACRAWWPQEIVAMTGSSTLQSAEQYHALFAEQQRLQTALVKVATAVSAGIGASFFEHLAQHMADALGAQIACVGRLLPPVQGQPRRLTTLSLMVDGVAQPLGEYTLDGTPSQQLLTQQQIVIDSNAAGHYPRAPML
ncbi:hypothetical protein, partial [Diaphorobacter sp.]|uniref:hypothetical protein n=1 Tax=Diaphorobacter sp. TaxID=1934310 RepID=UPI003D142526